MREAPSTFFLAFLSKVTALVTTCCNALTSRIVISTCDYSNKCLKRKRRRMGGQVLRLKRKKQRRCRSVGESVDRPKPPDLFDFFNFELLGHFRFPSLCLFFSWFCPFFVSFCLVSFFCCCIFFSVFGCTIYRPFARRSAVAADGDGFNYLVL